MEPEPHDLLSTCPPGIRHFTEIQICGENRREQGASRAQGVMIYKHQYVRQQEPGEVDGPRGPWSSEGSLTEKRGGGGGGGGGSYRE